MQSELWRQNGSLANTSMLLSELIAFNPDLRPQDLHGHAVIRISTGDEQYLEKHRSVNSV